VSAVDLARLRFATTSIYHFLFVSHTIGLALLTALLQTRGRPGTEPDRQR
jgi:cytochrome d ubiquinol oxidase subunit I